MSQIKHIYFRSNSVKGSKHKQYPNLDEIKSQLSILSTNVHFLSQKNRQLQSISQIVDFLPELKQSFDKLKYCQQQVGGMEKMLAEIQRSEHNKMKEKRRSMQTELNQIELKCEEIQKNMNGENQLMEDRKKVDNGKGEKEHKKEIIEKYLKKEFQEKYKEILNAIKKQQSRLKETPTISQSTFKKANTFQDMSLRAQEFSTIIGILNCRIKHQYDDILKNRVQENLQKRQQKLSQIEIQIENRLGLMRERIEFKKEYNGKKCYEIMKEIRIAEDIEQRQQAQSIFHRNYCSFEELGLANENSIRNERKEFALIDIVGNKSQWNSKLEKKCMQVLEDIYQLQSKWEQSFNQICQLIS